jgi:hypothetical protein
MAGLVFDSALDHRNRFERVVGSAFVASQPDYEWGISTPTTAAPFFYGNTMRISGRAARRRRGVGAGAQREPVPERARPPRRHDGVPRGSGDGRAATRAARAGGATALLAGLPVHSRAVAVVELRTPFAWDGVRTLHSTELPALGPVLWLEQPYQEVQFDGAVIRRPLTWPSTSIRGRSFAQWVRELHSSDARNLKPFGLPSIANLRTIARSPVVYAYLTKTVDVAELATLVRRPDVASVRLVDVRLPVG